MIIRVFLETFEDIIPSSNVKAYLNSLRSFIHDENAVLEVYRSGDLIPTTTIKTVDHFDKFVRSVYIL